MPALTSSSALLLSIPDGPSLLWWGPFVCLTHSLPGLNWSSVQMEYFINGFDYGGVGGPEMTVARRKLINPAALMLATVPVLIVFDSKIHPYLAAGWLHGMLASVQIGPGKEPRLLAHLKEQYLGTVTPESFPSGGLPCTVSHFRELSRECFDDPTFRGQGHHLLHSHIPRDGELRGLANWWTKGQHARACMWLGATYQPLIWRGAILTGLLDPNETINTETSFQAQSLEGASKTHLDHICSGLAKL